MVCARPGSTRRPPELGPPPPPDGEVLHSPAWPHTSAAVLAHTQPGQARRPRAKLAVLARPADLGAGEITDKGYINQRRVLATRASLLSHLYAHPVPENVIISAESAGPAIL